MGSSTKSGAQTSPDIQPFDDMALADLLGDFTGIESDTLSESLKYVPAVRDGKGRPAIAYLPSGGRLRLVEFDVEPSALVGLDGDDLRSETAAVVEGIAAWRRDVTAAQLRFLRSGEYKAGLHYDRLSGPEDQVSSSVHVNVVQPYVVQVFQCFSQVKKASFLFAIEAVKTQTEGRIVVRWGVVTGDPETVFPELRQGERLAAMLDAGLDLGDEGVILLEDGPTSEVQDNGYPVFVTESARPTNLTDGLDVIRKVRAFSASRDEADVFDSLPEDEATAHVEEPDF